MGRFHLQPHSAPEHDAPGEIHDGVAVIRLGVTVHHRTDEIFHQHPWFTQRVRSLRRDLEAAGLDRGAARAIAHVGPEMLLDGALLPDARESIDVTFGALERHRPRLGSWVERTIDWQRHLDRLIAHRLPTDYDDPAQVARRLLRILEHRPRLGFAADQLPMVVGLLGRRQASIVDTAGEFVADVVDRVESVFRG